MFTNTQKQYFPTTATPPRPTIFSAAAICTMPAGLERFKREGLGHNVATEIVWRENLHKECKWTTHLTA
jgi:hypothetical protein